MSYSRRTRLQHAAAHCESTIQSPSTYRCRACLWRMYAQPMHRTFTLSFDSFESSQVLWNTLSQPLTTSSPYPPLRLSLLRTNFVRTSEPANDIIVKLPMYLVYQVDRGVDGGEGTWRREPCDGRCIREHSPDRWRELTGCSCSLHAHPPRFSSTGDRRSKGERGWEWSRTWCAKNGRSPLARYNSFGPQCEPQ